MEKMFESVGEEERIQLLRDNCERVEKFAYTRGFSEDEIAEMREELADVNIEIFDREEEKKNAMKEFKELIDPKKRRQKELSKNLKYESEQMHEEVFLLAEHQKQKMKYVNHLGEVVYERPLLPSERQLSITNTGTDG